MTKSQRNHQW